MTCEECGERCCSFCGDCPDCGECDCEDPVTWGADELGEEEDDYGQA